MWINGSSSALSLVCSQKIELIDADKWLIERTLSCVHSKSWESTLLPKDDEHLAENFDNGIQ